MMGIGLALRQMQHGGWRILAAGLMLAATLGPILLIWGIKSGQIDTMLDAMRSDPANLEILLNNDTTLSEEALARMRAAPGLGYLVPTSRALSVRVYLSRADGSLREAVSLLPSTGGDPLLGMLASPEIGEAYVSTAIATAMGLTQGDSVLVRTLRTDSTTLFEAPVTILGIVPNDRLPGKRLLVGPGLVEDVESFLDGYAVARLELPGKTASAPPAPANARIYASDLEAVGPLEAALSELGFYVRAQNGNVKRLIQIEQLAGSAAQLVGWLLALAGVLGLWSGLALNLNPQRRNIALLRLMGSGGGAIAAYVTTIGGTIGALGALLSVAFFEASSLALNRLLAAPSGQAGPISALPAQSLLSFAAICLAIALLTSLVFGQRFLKIMPSEVLREETA